MEAGKQQGKPGTARAAQATGAPTASAFWGDPLLARGKLSFPHISGVQPGFGKDLSFVVPSFTSIAVNSSCLLARDVAEKPEALYFPGWQFFGSALIWLSVSSQSETVLPRAINDLLWVINCGHYSILIIADFSSSWDCTDHKVCCRNRFSVIPHTWC